jgi:hypothetical protein
MYGAAALLLLFVALSAQPVLEGRWLEHELGVFSRSYEFDRFASVRRLYFW